MKIVIGLVIVWLLIAFPAAAELQRRAIEYNHGAAVLEGYLVYDDALTAPRPGILVVHEWTGLGDYAKGRADQLAELGYVAFACDIYGKGIRPATPAAAGAQAGLYRANRELLRERVRAGLEILRRHPLVAPGELAAIGYCFGGGAVLELARSGAEVAGVVSFHGNLDTPDTTLARNIRAKVLVLHGADDPHVPWPQVTAFRAELAAAKVDWQLILYGNAVHSFTNPASGADPADGVAYHPAADRRSWDAMRRFFAELFPQRFLR